jgi:O-methyltransferase involved in polyketide biosynthesis
VPHSARIWNYWLGGLDIGTGLPTVDNTHEVAQRVAPECKIVYVDNDPLVLAQARALLTSTPEGECDYIHADLREPDSILRAAARTLDFSRPVALMLMEILGHVADNEQARAIVSRLVAELPTGSYLVIADGTTVVTSEFTEAQEDYDDTGVVPYKLRDSAQIARFCDGLNLLEPGLVPCLQWRSEVGRLTPSAGVEPLAAIARTT